MKSCLETLSTLYELQHFVLLFLYEHDEWCPALKITKDKNLTLECNQPTDALRETAFQNIIQSGGFSQED